MREYCNEFEIEDRQYFYELMRAVDQGYLKLKAAKREADAKKTPPKEPKE